MKLQAYKFIRNIEWNQQPIILFQHCCECSNHSWNFLSKITFLISLEILSEIIDINQWWFVENIYKILIYYNIILNIQDTELT